MPSSRPIASPSRCCLALLLGLVAACEGPGYPDAGPPPGSLTVSVLPGNLPNDGTSATIQIAESNLDGSPGNGQAEVSISHGQLPGGGSTAPVTVSGGAGAVSYTCALAQDPGCTGGTQVTVTVAMDSATASTSVAIDAATPACAGACRLGGAGDGGSDAGSPVSFIWTLPGGQSCANSYIGTMTVTVSNGTPFAPVTNIPCSGPGLGASSGSYLYPAPLLPGVYGVSIEGMDADGDGLANSQGTEKFCVAEGGGAPVITVNLTTAHHPADPLAAICAQ